MKMKIELTPDEAVKWATIAICQDVHQNMRSDGLDVSIISPPSDAPRYANPWYTTEAVRKLDYKRTEKIAAIKLVREMNPGMGLADAKYFVESLA